MFSQLVPYRLKKALRIEYMLNDIVADNNVKVAIWYLIANSIVCPAKDLDPLLLGIFCSKQVRFHPPVFDIV